MRKVGRHLSPHQRILNSVYEKNQNVKLACKDSAFLFHWPKNHGKNISYHINRIRNIAYVFSIYFLYADLQ